MPKRTFDRNAPYQSIRNTSHITGYSQSAIRAGCKSGEIPHVMVGKEYRVNVPLFLDLLEEKSRESLKLDTKKGPTSAAIAGRAETADNTSIPVFHCTTEIEVVQP